MSLHGITDGLTNSFASLERILLKALAILQ